MKQSRLQVMHPPQPHYPTTWNYSIWVGVIAILVLVVLAVAPALGIGSGNATASKDEVALELYAPDAARRDRAITVLGEAAVGGSEPALVSLMEFFKRGEYVHEHGLTTARAIASANTRPAYRALIQGFRANEDTTRRHAAMAALENANSTLTPLLIAALKDSDAGVRSTSAELLGFRKDMAAASALLAATYDPIPEVRAAAIWSLGGDLGVSSALERARALTATDPDGQVRGAAYNAETRIRENMARAIGVDASALLLVTVAPANGVTYAATADKLYVSRDGTNWQVANNLADRPTALAAGGREGQIVFLGTFGSGPFRSDDGGRNWKPITEGLPAAQRLTVDSLTVTAGAESDAQQVTMELSATFGTTDLHTTPLGVFKSSDGGNHWTQMTERAMAQQ